MNIAFFLTPKSQVAFLLESYTVRQALEKMRKHGYTAIPVLTKEGLYLGTVSEGDFLWYILEQKKSEDVKEMKSLEDIYLSDMIHNSKYIPVHIMTSVDELLAQATRQNFVPVLDDNEVFIGIVTRKDIIKYFTDKNSDL